MTHMNDDAIRATIKPPNERLSAAACAWRGMVRVNVPVVGLILAGSVIAILVGVTRPQDVPIDPPKLVLAGVIFIVCWIAAWTWWSWTVPHWRVWALQNAVDWPAAKRYAIRLGIIWPDGWIFEKTEIKSPALRYMEQVLRRTRETER